MGKKRNVGILFGGKSAEHEVSLQSAMNIYEALDREKYNPILIGIDKNGRWLLNDESRFLLEAADPRRIRLNMDGDPVALLPESKGILSNLSTQGKAGTIDVIFPILHGPFGEDGTVQGLLKLAGLPFVGTGVLASAVGMDKDVMKRLLMAAGLPVCKFKVLKSYEKIPAFGEIITKLGSPVFIKPANMGSSVGISKVNDEEKYLSAINEAFRFDGKILIEEFIKGREIECSVLGNENPQASVPGEVIPTHEFYSYDAKYIDENGAFLEIPAKISEECRRKIQELAIKSFQALECEGLSRVDFFLKENGEIIINEINTMPGFTRISMYPKLWEASGISYSSLIDILIELAFERFEKEKKLKTSV